MHHIQIVSYGTGHPLPPPPAHIVYNLAEHYRDPHRDPRMRQMTGRDELVRSRVLTTAGVPELLDAAEAAALAYLAGPVSAPLVIAFACVGGRHRSVVAADELAERLAAHGVAVTVHHRDIDRAVIDR